MKKLFWRSLLLWLLWPLLPVQAQGDAVIFMYHRFGEAKLPSTNIRMEQFRAQLDYLQQNNFTVWPLSRLVIALQQRQPIPDKTVALTVDDAYRSVYEQAFPELQRRGWPFTVFVSTSYVDKRYGNYMSWPQMREMRDAGVEFALHSASHEHLVERMADEETSAWRRRVRADLLQSHQRVRQELAIDSKLLAYPFGEYSVELQALVAELGWVGFGQHSGAVNYDSDMLALPRYPQSEYYGDLEQFSTKASSLALAVERLEPADALLNSAESPLLRVTLKHPPLQVAQLQCFAGGERLLVNWTQPGKVFEVQSSKPFTTRRGRYNCTVPAGNGRWYWFSQPWIILGQPEE